MKLYASQATSGQWPVSSKYTYAKKVGYLRGKHHAYFREVILITVCMKLKTDKRLRQGNNSVGGNEHNITNMQGTDDEGLK